jgi:hypothetical protein
MGILCNHTDHGRFRGRWSHLHDSELPVIDGLAGLAGRQAADIRPSFDSTRCHHLSPPEHHKELLNPLSDFELR